MLEERCEDKLTQTDTSPLSTPARRVVRLIPSADLCNDGVPHCRIYTVPVRTGISLNICPGR